MARLFVSFASPDLPIAEEVVEWLKMYVGGFKKVPGYNWTTFQQVYGNSWNAFLFISRIKSLSYTDGEFGSAAKAFEATFSQAELKKLHALEAAVVETEKTMLFRISPRISLPTEEMIKAEPNFWGPMPASMAKKPTPATASKP